MKKAYKALSVLMIVIMLAFTCTNVFAAINVNNITSNATLTGDVDNKMASFGSTILTIVTNIAMILAIVIIAVLGVKYMMGSMEEKAEYKKSMVPYLVGAVLVFGAAAIGKIVINFGQSI